jgi:hypothetical protein
MSLGQELCRVAITTRRRAARFQNGPRAFSRSAARAGSAQGAVAATASLKGSFMSRRYLSRSQIVSRLWAWAEAERASELERRSGPGRVRWRTLSWPSRLRPPDQRQQVSELMKA